jgi:mannose-6-phosphate isomerase
MSHALPTRQVEKPWGRDELPAPFKAPAGERIGEIWFEPPAALPDLLVKYIFTSEKLSVQVHPSDRQTEAKGLGRQGKEECWLVIAADEGASLGIGFDEPIAADAMRAAALDGSIEQRMTWHPVKPGDFFYIPANTVHAIGGGIALIEVQQNSDITYRLYDYGRPRELHLEDGMAVARGERYDSGRWHRQVGERDSVQLVDGPYFRLDQVSGAPLDEVAARYPGPLLVIPRAGAVKVGGERIVAGRCGLAERWDDIAFDGDSVVLLAAGCGVR